LDAETDEQAFKSRIVRVWLAALEKQYDPGTLRLLASRGVSDGWRCLEAGAGRGTIAHWLAGRVAPSGHVIASDIDTRFLRETVAPNLEVWTHDIVAEPLPEAAFDLVHDRLLLENLADRDSVLRKLASSLRVGGWLVLEENDNISIAAHPRGGPAVALHEKVRTAAGRLVGALAGRSDSGTYGRQLFGNLLAVGLSDVDAEGRVYMVRGGQARAIPWRLLYSQIGPSLVASGELTELELDEYAALLENPGFIMMGEIMMAAWGRRPR
jgi:SAM-dependent methyltransferase